MNERVPKQVADVRDRFPEVYTAFTKLAEACHDQGGPLDDRSRKLVKLAIAIGHRHEGAVHSAVRHAIAAGVTRDELLHVAILSVTTIGWPAARAAMTWIEDVTEDSASSSSELD